MRDDRISFGARGLLAHLMTHDEGWSTSVAALVKNGPQGKSAVNSLLKELENAGYLTREQTRQDTGLFESSKYTITDPFEAEISAVPGISPLTENRPTDNRHPDKRPTDNRAPKKTNTKNTNLEEEKLEEDGGETRVGTSPAAPEPEEPTTPWEDLNGKALERPVAPRRADRCDFHQGSDYPPPCFGCKDARKKMIERDREAFHAQLAQEKEVQLEAHRLRIERIDSCGLCDSDGYVNGWLCEHDPNRAERVASGAAMLRQALRSGQDG
jgi:hypothetical protein